MWYNGRVFAHQSALALLITADPLASEAEKATALAAIAGRPPQADGEVVSFRRAAEILGYKGPRGVYRALRDGVLQGYYGGKNHKRCTGILMSSIRAATADNCITS